MADWYSPFSGAGGQYRLHVYANEESIDPPNNRSLCRVIAWVDKLSGSGYGTSNSNASAGMIFGVAPVTVANWSPYDFTLYSSLPINDSYHWANHNPDGTGSINIQFSANDPNNFGYTDIGTQVLPLTTIPRGGGDKWDGTEWDMQMVEKWNGSAWVLQVSEKWSGSAWVKQI